MPGDAVLTGASSLACGHAPPKPPPGAPPPVPPPPGAPVPGAITTIPSTRLTVAGMGVLTVAPAQLAVAGCPLVSPGTTPCSTATVARTGAAVRLVVDGQPVLLASTLTATTNSVPPQLSVTVTVNQTLLTAE